MSPAYTNGRRGPNVTQFIRDLNTVLESPSEEQPSFNGLEEDIAMFTNTQFFDVDSGQNTDYQLHPLKSDDAPTATTAAEDIGSSLADMTSLDFMHSDFSFGEFASSYAAPSVQSYAEGLGNHLQPLQPNPAPVYGHPGPQQQNGYGSAASHVVDAGKSDSSLSSPTRPLSFEEKSRLAAEDDKRRRNTAASARFRVKKKQREQALEKSAKEMTEKVTMLESRIQQLETENKWLKNLIMEKNDNSPDVATLWKDFSEKNKAKAGTKDKSDVKAES